MYSLTKTEKDLLSLLNSLFPLTKSQLIEETCKNKESSFSARQVENAIEGCVAKGFVTQADSGLFKITEEGKKQF